LEQDEKGRKTMKINYFAIVGILILFAGCSALPTTDPLDGTSWELYAYRKSRPIEGSTLTISFEDGQIHGSAGCNSYGGSYEVDGGKITISEIFSTLMACPEPEGLMEQETMFLQFLGNAQRFEIVDGQLQIFWSDHEALTFVPQD
jgi:heat shock protein HslJ